MMPVLPPLFFCFVDPVSSSTSALQFTKFLSRTERSLLSLFLSKFVVNSLVFYFYFNISLNVSNLVDLKTFDGWAHENLIADICLKESSLHLMNDMHKETLGKAKVGQDEHVIPFF